MSSLAIPSLNIFHYGERLLKNGHTKQTEKVLQFSNRLLIVISSFPRHSPLWRILYIHTDFIWFHLIPPPQPPPPTHKLSLILCN